MAGKVTINIDQCKGCGPCKIACPKTCIEMSQKSNSKGYFPAQANNTDCTGYDDCVVVCSDAAIEVYRDSPEK